MPELTVHLSNGDTRTVTVSARPITLGRAESCDIILPGEEVSREHAEVWFDKTGQILVADKRSKNGTRVDDGDLFHNAVRPAYHSIRIGEHELRIVGQAGPAPPEATVRFQHDAPTQAGVTHYYPSNRPPRLDLNHRRLELLMRLTERIGGAFERKQLLEQALDACCEALAFERGLIALRTPRGEPEQPITRNVQRDESGAYTVSRTLINKALVDGECAVVNDVAVDLAGNLTESLVRFPIRSALSVPIRHRDETLGVIYGDRVTQTAKYSPDDVAFLAAIARQVGVGLANLHLVDRHVDLQKMLEELKQARTIQRNLLPSQPLHAGRVTLVGYNEPSSAVGGDCFDYVDLDDGRIGFMIADVTGHGLAAALMMANFQAAARITLTGMIPLDELGARLNRHVCRNTDTSVFITGIIGRLDPMTGQIEYVNAGHPAPLLLGSSDVQALDDGHALPLGVEPEEQFTVQRIELTRDGTAALFYTDGLTEAQDAAGQMLGLDPVLAELAAARERTGDTLLNSTLALVRQHLGTTGNTDDLTLLALHYATP